MCAAAFASDAKPRRAKPVQKSIMLPVTTSSLGARKEFDRAMVNLELQRRTDALDDLRNAVKRDPKFAQAYILISQLAPSVTKGERLLIRWLSGVQENNYVPAIAAMNDLLAMYPQDHRTAFLAGRWLVHQRRYAQ